MLMSLGPIVFDLSVNIDGYDIESEEDFARKDIVGARRPYEHVGAGDERLTLRGKLFPEKLGGAGAVDAILALKSTGTPQPVVRGDGKYLGWFVITRLSVQNDNLAADGAPRMIAFDATLDRTDPPSAASAFGSLVKLFG
jgi:phage protein U